MKKQLRREMKKLKLLLVLLKEMLMLNMSLEICITMEKVTIMEKV